MRDTTLLYLVKSDGTNITTLCLAMKKKGFGAGRFNGVGGKVEANETIESATDRETFEEIGVRVLEKRKIAELSFFFKYQPDWNQKVHVFFSEEWENEPSETEEMRPEWFPVEKIAYETMWPDDRYWLPQAIARKLIRASFVFGEKDAILEQQVEIVEAL